MKLKPCPFCGSRNVGLALHYPASMGFFSQCFDCHSKGPDVPPKTPWKPLTKGDAQELWNLRTTHHKGVKR